MSLEVSTCRSNALRTVNVINHHPSHRPCTSIHPFNQQSFSRLRRQIPHPDTLPFSYRDRLPSTRARRRRAINPLDCPPGIALSHQPLLPRPLAIPQQPQPHDQRDSHHAAHHGAYDGPLGQPTASAINDLGHRGGCAQRRPALPVTRHVGRRSRRRRGRHVVGVGGVEAGDVGEVEASGGDKGDVGAGVEGLVLGAVKVGRVFDLDGGVGAWGDGGASG